jgi:DNA-binding NarL/FixJ family response regulator
MKESPSAYANANSGRIKHRVFVIDDHPLMRRSMVEAIERESDLMVCGEAGDVPEAQAAILSLHPDLVLTDIQLKSSNGLELIKDLHARVPALLIVATTMFDLGRNERLARAAGAAGFASKQDGPEELITIIQAVLKTGQRTPSWPDSQSSKPEINFPGSQP